MEIKMEKEKGEIFRLLLKGLKSLLDQGNFSKYR